MIAHPCGWPAGRAKTFSALRKKKTATEKSLQKNVLWYLNVSGCKSFEAQSLKLKA
jgi:hypothetical protein